MRRAILMGFVWALGAGAATAQETDTVGANGCGSRRQAGERASLGLEVVGLTGGAEQRLVCFSEFRPARSETTIGIVGSGLSVDTRLVGIDYRPATGQLYGLGDAGGVYTLDAATADATLQSRLNVALNGTSFGVDFNPAVDRLRVVSDSGQNLRVDVTTGATTVDAVLNTPAGPALGVTAAAYTNNDADAATSTTLFDIQTSENSMLIQAPPSSGSLNFTGTLRQDVGTEAGFDIFSRVSSLGITSDNLGFAVLVTGGRSRFYSVNLFTGEATLRGTFQFNTPVVDIAIPTRQ